MDHQQLVLKQLFDGNGHRGITIGGHGFDSGQGFIGKVSSFDLIVIVNADKNAPAGGIGKGNQFPGQVAIDVLLEFEGITRDIQLRRENRHSNSIKREEYFYCQVQVLARTKKYNGNNRSNSWLHRLA